ncbi:flagellar protein FlhE [Acerihabitans sp. TG2]|uniref:flagellar protein FlhE n=1 Tax=Acerihabitans sp. TG2 TaxID=3096008 RepID=UPI002B228B6B|nr:flagellar protein FlhE [Acerihabitans sp. TG2]MEA9392611.1 flagellar protein FlhE [Acerihabitans sp. TG2]
MALFALMLTMAPKGIAAALQVRGAVSSPDTAGPVTRLPVLPPSIKAISTVDSRSIMNATAHPTASIGQPARRRVLADGGWEAMGHMLRVSRRGSIITSEPMRPADALTSGAQVTSIIWRIENQQPLPPGASMAICLSGKCVVLHGLAGRSDALAGLPADNPLTLQINVNGRGAIYPPILLTRYQVLVNYHVSP